MLESFEGGQCSNEFFANQMRNAGSKNAPTHLSNSNSVYFLVRDCSFSSPNPSSPRNGHGLRKEGQHEGLQRDPKA